MADQKLLRTPLVLSPEALFRYQIVSAVKARALSGQGIDAAVRAVAAQTHLTLAGEHKTVAIRSIYRWLAELDRDGPDGIETAKPTPTISRALPQRLLDFLAEEKAEDRYASVPELIRRACQHGVIGPHQRVDRTSVWRACVRLGLPLRRVPAKQEADQRRFAYPHRMMMALADGKHFRAGAGAESGWPCSSSTTPLASGSGSSSAPPRARRCSCAACMPSSGGSASWTSCS